MKKNDEIKDIENNVEFADIDVENNIENNVEFEDEKTDEIKHIGSVAGTIICTLLCIIGLLVLILYITGGRIMAVKTASMQDAYPVGSLVVIVDLDEKDIKEGMAIGFWLGSESESEGHFLDSGRTAVVHRVIKNDSENELIYTKGDSNNTADSSPVKYENVIGRVLFHIPVVGYPFILLGGRTVSIIAACLILAYIVFEIIRSIYGRKRESIDK